MPHQSSLEAALRKLREQEALAAEAERIADIGTYIYDPVANEALWSRHLRRIYGLADTDEPVANETVTRRIHPDDLPLFLTAVRGVVATGQPNQIEYRLIRPTGETRCVHARAELVHIEGHDNAVVVGTVQDVTERRISETLIQDQASLLRIMEAELVFQSTQSAMGTMASTLAHELNQPLATVTFLAAALQRAGPGRLRDDQIGEMLVSLKENALRAGQIIQRLRDSVASGGLKLERFTCQQVVEEAIRFASISCERIGFELNLGSHEIEGDRVQIQQVLVNLIRNACQSVSASPDGRVTITASPAPGPPKKLRISIADNGPGIKEDLLPEIFSSRVSTKPDGMGLGLSICRTIVEAHGGSISAANLAKGACFSFEIPVRAIPDEAASHGPPG